MTTALQSGWDDDMPPITVIEWGLLALMAVGAGSALTLAFLW